MIHNPEHSLIRQSTPLLHVNLKIFVLIGLCGILFFSPLFRGLFFQPELMQIQMIIAITFAFCVGDQLIKGQTDARYLPNEPLDWAVLGLLIAYCLSLITAIHMRSAIGEVLKMLSYSMVYWMAVRISHGEHQVDKGIDRLLIVIYASGIAVMIVGLLGVVGAFMFPGAFYDQILMSTFQYKNTLAAFLTAITVIGLGLSVKSENVYLRVIYAALNMIVLVAILGTHSRGGWILYFIAITAMIFCTPRQYRWRTVYQTMIFIGVGLITSRFFYTEIASTAHKMAVLYLILGTVVVSAVQAGYYFLAEWLNRDDVPDSTRRNVALGGAVYVALVVAYFVWSAASPTAITVSRIVPNQTVEAVQSISPTDISFRLRMEFDKNTLRIVKDYPIFGTGGGGWNALYHIYAKELYWTTEVHNYFFQTWIEAGTIGLIAVLSVWGLFFLMFIRYMKNRQDEDEDALSIITVGIMVLAIGLHSAVDFDMSFAAVAIMAFVGMGMVRGTLFYPAVGDDFEGNGIANTLDKKRMVFIGVVGALMVVALFVPSQRFYSAGVIGAEGAQELLKKQYLKALNSFYEAARLDPFTASYRADIAQIWAVPAVVSSNQDAKKQALVEAETAKQLEPYNVKMRGTLLAVYKGLQLHDMWIQEAESIVRINPLVPSHYELVGQAIIQSTWDALDKKDIKNAKKYLAQLPAVAEKSQEKTGSISPQMYLHLGQAAYIKGDYRMAEDYISQGEQADPRLNVEGELWKAAVKERTGRASEGRSYVDQINQLEYTQMFHSLIALPVLDNK